MFKTGQLIQSTKNGCYYVIYTTGFGNGYAMALKPISNPCTLMLTEHDPFRLVGNNYRPKPNTPAR